MIEQMTIPFNIMRLVLTLLFFLIENVSAQQREGVLSGGVRDLESREPLPAANIRVLESTKGTTTNREGLYRILLGVGKHRIVASYIGYRSDTLEVTIESPNVTRDIYLRTTVISMPEVVVIGDKRDPAEQIILNAIANKHKALSLLQSYRFNAYTKTTFRVKKETKESQDTVIAGLLETQTEGYWKAPNQYKEVITARRQSANFSPGQNIFTVGRMPNLNEDNIIVDRHSVVGPTAPNALEYYTFEMLDTSGIDDTYVFRIRMKPKSTARPLFDGVISIVDKFFQVMNVDVVGNEALDLAPLTDIRIRQQSAIFENRFWLPIESKITYTVKFSFPPVPSVLWEQYSLISDYEINQDIPESVFDKYVLTSLPTADRTDSTFWHNVNILPLTTEEVKAYERIDSIMAHTNVFTRSIVWLTRLPLTMRELPLTSVSDFFHFNRVEGAYVGVGFKFTPFSHSTTITLRTGYGFSDKIVKYSVGIEQALTSGGGLSVGAEAYRKLSSREGDDFVTPGQITWFSLLDKNDPVDYYRLSGWSLFARTEPLKNLSVEMRYLNENHQSATKNTDFSIFHRSANFRANPTVTDGQLRSVAISLTHDTRKFVDIGLFEAQDKSENSLLARLSVEHTNKKTFSSNFQFTRYSAFVHLHVLTFSSGELDGYLRLGYASGQLPPQRVFDLFGSTSGISREGFLRTIGVKEFAGDRAASLLLEHNFGSVFFRALGAPLMQNVDMVLTGGAAWTALSGESRVLQTVPLDTNRNILGEVGFGLGRLLTFFRLDFSWRLTEKSRKNFVITLASSLL